MGKSWRRIGIMKFTTIWMLIHDWNHHCKRIDLTFWSDDSAPPPLSDSLLVFYVYFLHCLSIYVNSEMKLLPMVLLFSRHAPISIFFRSFVSLASDESIQNGCRQQKHRKRTKTINNAGRVVLLQFLTESIYTANSSSLLFLEKKKFSLRLMYIHAEMNASRISILSYFLKVEVFRLISIGIALWKRNSNEIKRTKQQLLLLLLLLLVNNKNCLLWIGWEHIFRIQIKLMVKFCIENLQNEIDVIDSIEENR